MKNKFYFNIIGSLCVVCMIAISCSKKDTDETFEFQTQDIETKTIAFNNKTPKTVAYVEVNDVNPLNAGSYHLGTSVSEPAFYDVVILFAANIHKDASGNPTLFFNDNVTKIMADVNQYVVPLQNKGIKVLLGLLGDWQHIGFANLTNTQAENFARIIHYVVDHYGLDGVDFDDEYADYTTPPVNNTSYSELINRVRTKLGTEKLVTVFDWGNTNTINSMALNNINFAWHGYFGANNYLSASSSKISGMNNAKWSPISLNLGYTYNFYHLNQIKNNATKATNAGMGAMMTFNLRGATDVNPLPVLQKLADGAYGSTVTYDGNEYSKNWIPNTTVTIGINDLPSGY